MNNNIILTVDNVIFTRHRRTLQIYLLKRKNEPYIGQWALPGGWVNDKSDETSEVSAKRIIKTKTQIEVSHIEQLYTVANSNRDPRGWSAAIVYIGLARPDFEIDNNKEEGQWWPVDDLPKLAFDHDEIIQKGVERIRSKASYSPLPLWLLNNKFTMKDVWELYSDILGVKLDLAAFRRKILSQELIVETKEKEASDGGRPSQLYSWNNKVETFKRPWAAK
jgi:8-oxo-dGTP diphosphatase